MLNLIRMNVYRLIKSKFVIGLIIVAVVSSIFAIGMVDVDESSLEYEIMMEQGVDATEKGFGYTITSMLDPTVTAVMEGVLHSGLLLIAISVFAVMFSGGEKNSGYLKNIVLPKKKKFYLFVAKLVPVSIFSALCFAVSIFSVLCTVGQLEFGAIALLIPEMTIQLLLHIAFAACMLAYMELFRNQAIGLVLAFFGSTGAHLVGVKLLEDALAGFGIPRFLMFGEKMIVVATGGMSVEMPEAFLSCTMTAVFGIIMYMVMGSVIFSKKDV